MIKVITYINHDSFLEFNFNNAEISYFPEARWVNIFTTKQKITLQNNFIAFQDDAAGTAIAADSLTKIWIQDLYKQNKKLLIITSPQDEPIRLFWGEEISIIKSSNPFYQFKIDEKYIWTYGMKFMILTHNNPA